jgi:coniferyl-aldehyde dehydrogenase
VNDPDLSALLASQRSAFLADGPPDAATRIDRIDRCIALLKENADRLERTISADFGNRSLHASGLTDIMTPVAALQHSRKHLRRWMRPERPPVEPRLLGMLGARAEIVFQPKGVVGVVAPWNFPVGLVVSPLANVLAAGNRAIVKPSEHTPRTSDLLQELIAARFDARELAVVTGGPELGAAFTGLPFDHLIFTGAGSVARHVMRAASQNLVPLTLELGGKSPVVIGQGADLGVAASRIMAGKLLNAGQICLAPDHVFLPNAHQAAFVDQVARAVRTMLPTVRDNPDYTAIISDRHHERLTGYVEDARRKGGKIVELSPAGETFAQQEHRKIPPTLILDATPDMDVMKDEIFGPLLPVMTYDRLPDVVDRINAGERPLALYYFGTSQSELDLLTSRTTSGGICINDVIMHCAQENLPFGGVGPSSMGAYHGHDGFLEFSHRKAVYRQIKRDLGRLRAFRPPYDQRVRKLVRSVIGA